MILNLIVILFCLISVGCASNPSNDVKVDNQMRIVNCRPKLEVGTVVTANEWFTMLSPTTKVKYECDHEAIPNAEELSVQKTYKANLTH